MKTKKQLTEYRTASWKWFAPVALLLAAQAFAQNSDHPLIDRFPDSEIVDVEFEEDANYRLVLGTLQRTRGIVVPESSERLRGDVTKIIYEVSEEFTGDDVLSFYQEQFAARGYEVLFTCSGRECGSSNYWANDIFSNRVLYGPERNQHFVALRISGDANNVDDNPAHMVLYIITRGNRRLYAYVEIVEENGSVPTIELIPSELLDNLNEQGSAIIPGVAFLNDRQLLPDSELEAVAQQLNSQPELEFYVVAHLGGEQELDQLMTRSNIRAQTVRQQLINLGVAANRLVARGIGPLAPACVADSCAERVELVLR
jgi:hypothetical protein